ncbi:MAG: arylesterase [Acidobacteria bacterium]|jgi:acyl-CoA thioesterase I|nr:arylesterase [Acidobacteriota bacterium]
MRFYLVTLVVMLAGCSKPPEPVQTPAPVEAPVPKKEAKRDDRPVIVAFGDSLSAGYGLEAGEAYPDYLQKALDAKGYRYRVVNQGISGDTTSGGVERIPLALAEKPAIVILELGGNDGLRGLPVAMSKQNMDRMIQEFKAAGAQVILAGITLPRNYGPDYIRDFEQMYPTLATKYKIPRIKFFLEGVATVPALMQQDQIHPTAEGCKMVANRVVLPVLEPLLRKN